MNESFETVIGLEVHLQLQTKTKIFCGCANVFGKAPNTITCPVCLGLPGSLPVLNKQALQFAIKVALALNCQVNTFIKFDRKNYYYPDLPKGYQISQYDFPIGHDGALTIKTNGHIKHIGIIRTHLEEDAGKLIHDNENSCSLIDYNRTGTPLLEIVSCPDLRNAQEAYDYLTALKLTLQYLDVSDCDMEKGSLRCDANISVRQKGEKTLGTKTEIKNLNSFKAVKAALDFEENRQRKLLKAGGIIIQETRLWSEDKQATFSMRSKEGAHDYRYFPEPDLVPFVVEKNHIDKIAQSLPELPLKKMERFQTQYHLPEYDAQILIQDKNIADFFEQCASHYQETKKIANWIIGPLQQELNALKKNIRDISLNTNDFIDLISKVEKGTLNNLRGKEVLRYMIETGKSSHDIIAEKGLSQVSDEKTLERIVDSIIEGHHQVAEQIRRGEQKPIGFLVGQAMRKSQGKANPKKIGEIIRRRLLNG